MKKRLVILLLVIIVPALLASCIYLQQPPPDDPGDVGNKGQEEPAPGEPGEPAPSDKSSNPNERITMEGSVVSVNDDKVVIEWPGGGNYTLRLSENTEWDPAIESWDIVPGNYLVVTVAVEGRTQGEVVRIIQNIIAE